MSGQMERLSKFKRNKKGNANRIINKCNAKMQRHRCYVNLHVYHVTERRGWPYPDVCVLIFSFILVITSLGGMIIIDFIGRKPMLYVSGIVCALAQGTIAFYFYSKNLSDYSIFQHQWIPYVCMLAFGTFYQPGIGKDLQKLIIIKNYVIFKKNF